MWEEGSRPGNCSPQRLSGFLTTKAAAVSFCESWNSQNQVSVCNAVYEQNGMFEARACGNTQKALGWCYGYPDVPMSQERCDTGNGGTTYFYRYSSARRRLTEQEDRRLAGAGAGPVSPFTFGLTMSISNRTLRIRSNTVPRRQDPPALPAPAPEPVDAFDRSSGEAAESGGAPVAAIAAAAGAAMALVGAALLAHRRKHRTVASTPRAESASDTVDGQI